MNWLKKPISYVAGYRLDAVRYSNGSLTLICCTLTPKILDTNKLPPIHTSLATLTPPATCNAPVVPLASVALVVLFRSKVVSVPADPRMLPVVLIKPVAFNEPVLTSVATRLPVVLN